MKKLTILLFLLFAFNQIKAQTIRYFINQYETIPNSLDFLDPNQIDSVRFFEAETVTPLLKVNINPKEKFIVVFMKKDAKLLTFEQLLVAFSIRKEAVSFPIVATSTAIFKDEYPLTKQLIVCENMIDRVSIYRKDGAEEVVIVKRLFHDNKSSMAYTINSITSKLHKTNFK